MGKKLIKNFQLMVFKESNSLFDVSASLSNAYWGLVAYGMRTITQEWVNVTFQQTFFGLIGIDSAISNDDSIPSALHVGQKWAKNTDQFKLQDFLFYLRNFYIKTFCPSTSHRLL